MDIRLDTVYQCTTRLCGAGAEMTFEVNKDLAVGDTVLYKHFAYDGGYVKVRDSKGTVIKEYVAEARADDDCCVGGGFVVTEAYASVISGPTVEVSKKHGVTVEQLINDAEDLMDLIQTLNELSFDAGDRQQVINLYFETRVRGSGGTNDYNALSNKPSINSVELSGDKSFDDLGLVAMSDTELLEILNKED